MKHSNKCNVKMYSQRGGKENKTKHEKIQKLEKDKTQGEPHYREDSVTLTM